MKLRRSLSEPEQPTELNLIPLIDVIMFLLIFFISTTSFMDIRGLHVDKPQSAGAAQNEGDSILLAVQSDGKILFGRQEINLEGVRSTVKRLCSERPLPVVIRADEKSRSGIVMRVIDEAMRGGAKDVSVASHKS